MVVDAGTDDALGDGAIMSGLNVAVGVVDTLAGMRVVFESKVICVLIG